MTPPNFRLLIQVVTLQEPGLDAALLGPGPTPMLAELEALAQRYAEERTRAELGQAWRPGLSKLHKLMASLEAWLGYCPAKQRQFLQSLQPVVQAAWGLQGPLQVSCTLIMKIIIQMIINSDNNNNNRNNDINNNINSNQSSNNSGNCNNNNTNNNSNNNDNNNNNDNHTNNASQRVMS